MTILQLRYFLLVASNGNLTASAESLMISPSALSRAISRLEEDLGTSLFERSANGMHLTDNGIIVQEAASKALAILNDMTETIAYNSTNDDKHISIATTALLSGKDLIVAFKKAYPEILVSYNEIFSPHFHLEELSSQYDFLISSEENTMDQSLNSLRLFSHPPVLLVPISNSLANRQSISLAECSCLPIINSPSNTPWAKYVANLFKQANLRFKPVIECPYDIRVKLVGDGIGVTLVSETSLKLSTLPPNVVALRIDEVEVEHAVWLYWSKFKKKNYALKLFIEFVRQFYH